MTQWRVLFDFSPAIITNCKENMLALATFFLYDVLSMSIGKMWRKNMINKVQSSNSFGMTEKIRLKGGPKAKLSANVRPSTKTNTAATKTGNFIVPREQVVEDVLRQFDGLGKTLAIPSPRPSLRDDF